MGNRLIITGGSTLTDSDIFGGVNYEKIVNPSVNWEVGNVAAAKIQFKVKNNIFHIGDELDYYYYKLSGLGRHVGWFNVTDIVKGKTDYTITAFDRIAKLEKDCSDWKNGLTFPMTLREIFISGCTALNLSYALPADTSVLPALNYSVGNNYLNDGLTFRQVFSYIAAATGFICEADIQGRIALTPPSSMDRGTFTSANYKTLEEADYTVAMIDETWSGIDDSDIGVFYPNNTGTNVLKIYNNPFLYVDDINTETIVRAQLQWPHSLSRVTGLRQYKPFKLTTFMEELTVNAVGQRITINGEKRVVMTLRWDSNGITMESTGDPDRTNGNIYGNSEQKMNGAFNRLTRDLNGTISEVGKKVDSGSIISTINQSAETITISASKVNLNGYVTMTNLSTPGETSVNGSNINSGIITLGGNNNGNGQLNIVNSSNTKMGQWNNAGAVIWDDTTYANSQTGNATFKILRVGDTESSHYGIFEGVTEITGTSTKYPFINLRSTNSSGAEGGTMMINADYLRTSKSYWNYNNTIQITDSVQLQPSGIDLNEVYTDITTSPATITNYHSQISARVIDRIDNGDASVTNRSGAWTYNNAKLYIWGNVAQFCLCLNLNSGGDYYAGNNIFEATLDVGSHPWLPIAWATGAGYMSGASYEMWLRNDGTFTVRLTGNVSNWSGNTWPAYISTTYLFQDK